MESYRKSIAASLISKIFGAGLSIVALPIYIKILGAEAYGLVGLLTSLQVFLAFLDFGLANTLTRQLATYSALPSYRQYERNLMKTFELTHLSITTLIGIVLIFLAPIFVAKWVNPVALTESEIYYSSLLGAFALAAQWPINFYSAAMTGVHRQYELAINNGFFSIFRVSSTLIILNLQPNLPNFFWAQILASILQATTMHFQIWHHLPCLNHKAVFKTNLLKEQKHFAGAMTLLTLTGVFLTQLDKIILSRILSLADFGFYAFCAAITAGLYITIGSLFSVIYPRFVMILQTKSQADLSKFYHSSAQLMTLLIFPAAITLSAFPNQALFVLIGNHSFDINSGLILSFLLMGTALNGAMTVPYALQLAAGWTKLTIVINLVAILILCPLTWWLAHRWGAVGGAFVWFSLNFGYFLITPHLMHRRLLSSEKLNWYHNDTIKPIVMICISIAAFSTITPATNLTRGWTLLYLALCFLVATASAFAVSTQIRREGWFYIKNRMT